MSDLNSRHNRAVWFDLPVLDLDRAVRFYGDVLGVKVQVERFDAFIFAVLDHDQGNGGCLIPTRNPAEIQRDGGILLYLNVDGRIRDAVAKVRTSGGEVLEDVHTIGPHGCRAIVRDSEGNRVALHSTRDA
jgi:uncharacterized protein